MKIIIVGGGQVGSFLGNMLISNGHQVKIVESRESNYSRISERFSEDTVIFGDGTSPDLLEAIGITSADVVAAVTGNDEVNLVVSTLAKFEFGVPKVVARVNDPSNAWLFDTKMGVDAQVNQADILAHLVAEDMDHKDMFTLLKLSSGDYSIIQVQLDEHSKVVNKKVKELVFPKNSLLITIKHHNQTIIPDGETTLQAGDHLMILTSEANRELLKEMF